MADELETLEIADSEEEAVFLDVGNIDWLKIEFQSLSPTEFELYRIEAKKYIDWVIGHFRLSGTLRLGMEEALNNLIFMDVDVAKRFVKALTLSENIYSEDVKYRIRGESFKNDTGIVNVAAIDMEEIMKVFYPDTDMCVEFIREFHIMHLIFHELTHSIQAPHLETELGEAFVEFLVVTYLAKFSENNQILQEHLNHKYIGLSLFGDFVEKFNILFKQHGKFLIQHLTGTIYYKELGFSQRPFFREHFPVLRKRGNKQMTILMKSIERDLRHMFGQDFETEP